MGPIGGQSTGECQEQIQALLLKGGQDWNIYVDFWSVYLKPPERLQVKTKEDLRGRRQTVHTTVSTIPQQIQVIYI